MTNALSIHPRAWGGRALHEKRSTYKQVDKTKLAAKLVRMGEHVDRHSNDGATKNHMAKKQARL